MASHHPQADGYPPTYKSGFPTKQEAKDWASDEETRHRQETYFPAQIAKKHTRTSHKPIY